MPAISVQKPSPKLKAPLTTKSKGGGVLERILPLGESLEDGYKIILYGDTATGKTTTWATWPGPILAIICSGGFKPGELRSVNTVENRTKIDTVTLNQASEMKTILDNAHKLGKTYKTFVLDHVTGLQDLALKDVMNLDELPPQKSWGFATREDYGAATLMTKEYLRSLLNLPGHVIIIGQERVFGGKSEESGDDAIGVATIGVAVTPSLSKWLNPACDYILQHFKRRKMIQRKVKVGNQEIVKLEPTNEIEYCARCEPHEVYSTKFRVPKGRKLPDVIVNPTYEKIHAVIQGG